MNQADFESCVKQQQLANLTADLAKESQDLADSSLNSLRQRIRDGESIGDPLLDLVLLWHRDCTADQAATVRGQYQELGRLCALAPGQLFLAVTAEGSVYDDLYSVKETLYLGKVVPPGALRVQISHATCQFPVEPYVSYSVVCSSFSHPDEPIVPHQATGPLSNRNLELSLWGKPLVPAHTGRQWTRLVERSDGPEAVDGLEYGKPYFELEVHVGDSAVHEWFRTHGPTRAKIFEALNQALKGMYVVVT